MKKRLFYRLSSQAYKTLKALGLPMRARPWRRRPTADDYRQQLLDYCEQDTLAMVEVQRALIALCGQD